MVLQTVRQLTSGLKVEWGGIGDRGEVWGQGTGSIIRCWKARSAEEQV